MKKITTIIAVLCLAASINASAQVFRLGVGLVGVSPSKNTVAVQVPLIDLGWAPTPSYDFGIYSAAALKASADDVENESGEATGGFRIGAQGRYFFMADRVFKPYIGLQAGVLAGAKVQIGDVDNSEKTENKFQVSPMAGFRVGPLNVWANYMNKNVYANVGLLFGIGSFK